jgi:hypothetical protein
MPTNDVSESYFIFRQMRLQFEFWLTCTCINVTLKAHTDQRPDAIWQRDANFQFSVTFNFNIFLCFSNIPTPLKQFFSYLVCISCKIFIRWRIYFKIRDPKRNKGICRTENYRSIIHPKAQSRLEWKIRTVKCLGFRNLNIKDRITVVPIEVLLKYRFNTLPRADQFISSSSSRYSYTS